MVGGIALAVCLTFTGCSPSNTPTSRRGPVSLEDSEAVASGPRSVNVEVPSCNGDPVVDELLEEAEVVRLRIVTSVTSPGDACLDSLEVELEGPLGDRDVVDNLGDAVAGPPEAMMVVWIHRSSPLDDARETQPAGSRITAPAAAPAHSGSSNPVPRRCSG